MSDGDSRSAGSAAGRSQPIRISLVLITIVAIGFALYFAKPVILPFTIALVLNLMFAPTVKQFSRRGVPSVVSAALIITFIVGLLAGGIYVLSDPAKEWIAQAPTSIRQAASQMEDVKSPLEGIREIGDEVDEITEIESKKPKPPAIEIKEKDTLERVGEQVPRFLVSSWVTLTLTFFMLVGGNRGTQRLQALGSSWKRKRQIIRISREVHDEVSRYLRTITVINIVLGAVTGLVLWQLGIPNPHLWGTMVAVLNFAPYLGALVSAVVLGLVSVMTFPSLTEALVAPAVFLVLTTLEGAVLTPLILGSRLRLSSLTVFLAVIFWGWLWGPAGALIAVPIMIALQVILYSTRRGKPLAILMRH